MSNLLPSEPRRLPISAIILTKDEERHLAECLRALAVVDEVIVVDSGSRDATLRIAEQGGARVVQQPWLGFGKQRQAAEATARHEWILMIDADERLSPELQAELLSSFAAWSAQAELVTLPRVTWYMGRQMRWYRPFAHDRVARLYRRGRARWSDDLVHERLITEAGARTALATQVLRHFSYASVTHHLAKSSRYIDLWAQQAHARGKRSGVLLPLCIFPVHFLRDALLRLGILDGGPGLTAAFVTAFSSTLKRLRLAELQRTQPACSPQPMQPTQPTERQP